MSLKLTTLTIQICLLSTALGEMRAWVNDKNRSAEGELISATETHAVIHFKGQKSSREVALTTLSTNDQEFIAEWLTQEKDKSTKKKVTYDPNASYRDRQKNLSALTENIPDNFDAEWPKLIKSPEGLEIALVEEDATNNKYVYHSNHYEFICDVPLKPHLVKRFATLFEGTREVCRALPISTKKAHIAGETHRNRILLFETREAYVKNGGPPQSGGVFIGGKDIVMVPLTSLGVKKVGSSYSIDYKDDNKTLSHELAHQITDRVYYQLGARGWFSEGLADYVGTTPYRSGNFFISKSVGAAKEYATGFGREGNGGRHMGEKISAPDLKTYMLQDYSRFTGESANFNYGLALLITTYFFHMDGDGDRVAITSFLKALREGKKGEEALEVLRQGRTFDELAKDISKGWRSKGVRITFPESGE